MTDRYDVTSAAPTVLVRATLVALAVLGLATAYCGAIILFGPELADRANSYLATGTDFTTSYAVSIVLIFGLLVVAALPVRLVFARDHRVALRPAGSGVLTGAGIALFGLIVALFVGLTQDVVVTISHPAPVAAMLATGAGLILFQTFAEEYFFRGMLQPILTMRIGAAAGIGLTSVSFAALHVLGGAESPISIVNLLLGGVVFGMLAWRAGNIIAATAAHFCWNAAEALVLGLVPNPGQSPFGSLFDFDLVGPAHWGGSFEGLNASLAMTVGLATMVGMVCLRMPWLRAPVSAVPPGPRRSGHAPR